MNKQLAEMPKSILADIAADFIRDNGHQIVKSWDAEEITYFELQSTNGWGNQVLGIKLEDMPYWTEFKEVSVTVDELDESGEYDITLNVSTYDKDLKLKDFEYDIIKSYKRKGSAMKFAEQLALDNNYGFSGFVEHSSRY